MRFSIVLYLFYVLIKFTSWRSKSFKERISEKNCLMLIGTFDKKKVRYYSFSGGQVHSEKTSSVKPDFMILWKDADIGYKNLARFNNKSMMKAINSGDMKLEGDAQTMTWFLGTLNVLKGIYTKTKAA